MSVNGITGSVATSSAGVYEYTTSKPTGTVTQKGTAEVSAKSSAASEGVKFERSADVQAEKSSAENKKTYKQDPKLVAQLKADAEAHTQQLQNIVSQLFSKQGMTVDIAKGTNLKQMFEGIEVDPATRSQAQADIAEDGYWGVKQTSERIFDFAKALSGGDPDKMEDMRKAFEKGFQQATKAWGDELPDISQRTYGAVQSLFDDYAEQMRAGTTTA